VSASIKYFKHICIFNIYAKIKKRAGAVAAGKLKSNNETLIPWVGGRENRGREGKNTRKTAQRKNDVVQNYAHAVKTRGFLRVRLHSER